MAGYASRCPLLAHPLALWLTGRLLRALLGQHTLSLFFETGSALLTVTCCRLPGWRSEVSRRSGSSPRSPPASSRVLESTLREQGGHLVQVRGPGREGEGSSLTGTFSIACPCHYVFLQESLPLCRHRPGVWDRAGSGTARFGDLWMLP